MFPFLRQVKRWILYNARYKRRFEFGRPRLGFGLYNFADDGEAGHWSIFFVCLWVTLWRAKKPPRDPDGMLDSWSVCFKPLGERYLHVEWGTWQRFFSLPWSFDYIETAVMDSRGEFVRTEYVERGHRATVVLAYPLAPQIFPFRYQLRNGTVQIMTVTVKAVERRRWQWKLFRRLRLPLGIKTRHSLDLWFSSELGSEAGSWKGGVIACGCDYRPGESIETALRRFELYATTIHRFCR